MLGSPGAHLILIFTRHVNEGRVERGSAWKDKRRISLYRLFGSKVFMPCASLKSLFAGLSKLAVPCKFANLPRESRNVRITALPYHPSSQEDDPGDIRRGGSGIAALRLACEASRSKAETHCSLSSRGRLSTFPLHHMEAKFQSNCHNVIGCLPRC